MSENAEPKFWRKNWALLLNVVLIVVFGVLIYLRSARVPDLQAEADQVSRDLEIILHNEVHGTHLAADLKELESIMGNMDTRLLDVDAKAVSFQFFYYIERRARVTIESLNQLEVQSKGDGIRPDLKDFTAIKFRVNFSGRLFFVLNFLKRLETAQYFVRVTSAEFRANTALARDGLDVVLDLEVLAKK